MELELEQVDRRYEALRTRSARREKRLLASIAENGQQTPIVVVRDGEQWDVVDGYKRLRVLGRLGLDTVQAAEWLLCEAEALMLERILRSSDADSAIEQGWFLHELVTRFGLGLDELARRFDRSKSWVSRRIGLVAELPQSVQEHVRSGAIGGHAAMKHLVPLARANADHCAQIADAIAPHRPTSRQMAVLYAAYTGGNRVVRRRVVGDPILVLKAHAESEGEGRTATPVEHLLEDLSIVGAVARRARTRIAHGALDDASTEERARARESSDEAYEAAHRLKQRCDRELGVNTTEAKDAGPEDAVGHSAAT